MTQKDVKDMISNTTFPGVNFKSPMVIISFIFFIPFFILMIFLAFIVPFIWAKILLIILGLLSPSIFVFSLTAKIIIDNDTVTKKSFFTKKTLKFNEIVKFGVFLQEPKISMPLSRRDYDKKHWFGTTVIYLSTKKNYNPIFSFSNKGSLRFHYFKDLFEIIEKRLKDFNITTDNK